MNVSLIDPFPALRPAPGQAGEIIAPPYDVVSTEEARTLTTGRPWSFLHVSRPEIDFPPGTDPHAEEVYARAGENLSRMITAGVLRRDTEPCHYIYRIRLGDHVQTGLVGAAAVAAYDNGRIRRHEFTRPDKEDDRVRHIEAVGGHTGPVLAAYPQAAAVDVLLAALSVGTPTEVATGPDGSEHALWVVRDVAHQTELTGAFDAMQALYIADGHHRSAAASRVAAAWRARGCGPEHPSQRFLLAAFPHRQMRILPYHRVVADLQGRTPTAFLDTLRSAFTVTPESSAVAPTTSTEFGLRLGGSWYRLRLDPGIGDRGNRVARLGVSLLATHVLEPLLGITDPRRDPRIDFVGGSRGTGELERRVDSGKWAAAFSLAPTPMADLMAVADAGEVMPPKSTWFEPKLADGLVSLMLRD